MALVSKNRLEEYGVQDPHDEIALVTTPEYEVDRCKGYSAIALDTHARVCGHDRIISILFKSIISQ
jgi:hypothetical protein